MDPGGFPRAQNNTLFKSNSNEVFDDDRCSRYGMRYPRHPVITNPYREMRFTERTGWRFSVRDLSKDRLGDSRDFLNDTASEGLPIAWGETTIETKGPSTIQMSLEEEAASNSMNIEDIMNRLREIESPTLTFRTKRPREDGDATERKEQKSIVSFPGTASTKSLSTATPASSKEPHQMQIDTSQLDLTLAKGALHKFYGRQGKHKRAQLQGRDFISWDNGHRQQDRRYTSVFCCPHTKELFTSGRGHDSIQYSLDGIFVWYSTKKMAEHAAAARALECFLYRQHESQAAKYLLDDPYNYTQGPLFPWNSVSTEVRQKLLEAKDQVEKNSEPRPPASETPRNAQQIPLSTNRPAHPGIPMKPPPPIHHPNADLDHPAWRSRHHTQCNPARPFSQRQNRYNYPQDRHFPVNSHFSNNSWTRNDGGPRRDSPEPPPRNNQYNEEW